MKNKSIVVLILSSLVVFAGCGDDMTNRSGGTSDGTVSCSEVAIKVGTYPEFDKIRENLGGNYCLTANIDFEMRTDFEPIGTQAEPFTGVLDGAGHTIKNVKIEKKGSYYVGVIGYAKGATIKKFVVENANVKGSSSVGAVVGEVHDSKIMELSVIGGIVEGSYSMVGGLVGTIVDSAIENSYSTASATYTGTPTERIKINIGGLVGYNSSYSSIKNSYATGAVTYTYTGTPPEGTEINIGGLVGEDYSKTVSNSYYDKEGTKQTDIGKGTGVSGKANIVKRDNKYYDSKGTSSEDDDVEIFKGWDFASVWVFYRKTVAKACMANELTL